jgi:taurine dioxygenase
MSAVGLTVTPLTGRIGAVIDGVDLAEEVTDPQVDAIRAALLTHRVIFFRDQHLDRDRHEAFAARFGIVTPAHPTLPSVQDRPNLLELDGTKASGRADNWHTDVTYLLRPPLGAVLRAVELPPYGGDTVWANTVGAYEDLPEPLRALADVSWAVHTNMFDDVRGAGATAYERLPMTEAARIETEHPLVRVHPETGERSLLLGVFARRVVGLSVSQSAAILGLLQEYVTRPENCVRWSWRAGDVAFWDNRSTQHYAIYDYAGNPRSMERITLAGDVSTAIDGAVSRPRGI